MTDSYTAPTDRADMRSYILRLYIDSVESAAELKNWMLMQEGKRAGTFRGKYTPFYNAFLKLYFCTRCICLSAEKDDLKMRIDTWISRSQGSVSDVVNSKDRLIEVGLELFELWSKKLFDQSILEFR